MCEIFYCFSPLIAVSCDMHLLVLFFVVSDAVYVFVVLSQRVAIRIVLFVSHAMRKAFDLCFGMLCKHFFEFI